MVYVGQDRPTGWVICHYGVKGMKWGVINEDELVGRLKAKAKDATSTIRRGASEVTSTARRTASAGSNAIKRGTTAVTNTARRATSGASNTVRSVQNTTATVAKKVTDSAGNVKYQVVVKSSKIKKEARKAANSARQKATATANNVKKETNKIQKKIDKTVSKAKKQKSKVSKLIGSKSERSRKLSDQELLEIKNSPNVKELNQRRRKQVDPNRVKEQKKKAAIAMATGAVATAAAIALTTKMPATGLALAAASGHVAMDNAMKLYEHEKGMRQSEQYFENREENGKIDPETGLYKKQEEMSMQQDLKTVNPEFKTFDAEVKQNNCMLCTTTYDLRRRGYDVTAQYADMGYNLDSITEWYPDAEVREVSFIDEKGQASREALMENTIKELESQGEGARGNLMVYWDGGGGHSVAYEVKDGRLYVLDGQTNKVYSNPRELLQYTNAAAYARLDNVEPNIEEIKKECCR